MVSIIIPTYNGSQYISRAIESILNQTFSDYEIIVVDDNDPKSEERFKTESAIAKFLPQTNFNYIKHSNNMNGAYARNTGIKLAKGEFIAFLDDDDVYLRDRLSICVSFLNNHKEYCGVITGTELRNVNDKLIDSYIPQEDLSVEKLLLDEMAIGSGSNIFLRTDIVREINGFDSRFLRRQDIEFMIRICNNGRVGFISDILLIKYQNGFANLPEYNKMKHNLELFCDKFKQDIDSLSCPNLFYRKEYLMLLRTAYIYNDKTALKEASRLATSVAGKSLTYRMRICLFYFRIYDSKIIVALRKIKKSLLN